MTENAADEEDGLPWEAMVSPGRRRVAAAIQQLSETLVCHEADDDTLQRVAGELEQLAGDIVTGPDRTRAIDTLKYAAYENPPTDGERTHHNPDCIVCGPGNPAGVGMVVHRDGDGVIGRMTIDRIGAGAPGRAHGGLLALAIDDLMGHVLVVSETAAYTVKLDVEYLAAPPVDDPIELRAWLHSRDGRRLVIRAEARAGDELLARAEALFISVDRLTGSPRPGHEEPIGPSEAEAASDDLLHDLGGATVDPADA